MILNSVVYVQLTYQAIIRNQKGKKYIFKHARIQKVCLPIIFFENIIWIYSLAKQGIKWKMRIKYENNEAEPEESQDQVCPDGSRKPGESAVVLQQRSIGTRQTTFSIF